MLNTFEKTGKSTAAVLHPNSERGTNNNRVSPHCEIAPHICRPAARCAVLLPCFNTTIQQYTGTSTKLSSSVCLCLCVSGGFRKSLIFRQMKAVMITARLPPAVRRARFVRGSAADTSRYGNVARVLVFINKFERQRTNAGGETTH